MPFVLCTKDYPIEIRVFLLPKSLDKDNKESTRTKTKNMLCIKIFSAVIRVES